MTKSRKIKTAIINAAKAIRKKQMQLKMSRVDREDTIQKSYKPITDPIKDLTAVVRSESIKRPILELGDAVQKESKSIRESLIDISDAVKRPKLEIKPEDAKPEVTLKDYLNQYQKYLDGLHPEYRGIFDLGSTGVYYDNDKKQYKLGGALFSIDGTDILIDNTRYKGTLGLYELIFKKRPDNYTADDEQTYGAIIKQTNLHRRNYDATQQPQGNPSYKYTQIIRPISIQHQKSGSGVQISSPIGEELIVRSEPYQYVYFDDINEIVERLRLLVSSKAAGHTGHENEIASIVEELREAGVIV